MTCQMASQFELILQIGAIFSIKTGSAASRTHAA